MTAPPVITLERQGNRVELLPGRNDTEVEEGTWLLTLSSTIQPVVELDDLKLSIGWRGREGVAVGAFDLTNQVGFHRLRVRVGAGVFNFDFQTITAKAAVDEVKLMAEVCCNSYLGFRRQFTYYAANGERRRVLLPQIQFAWLRDRLPEIAALARSINERPATSSERCSRASTRAKGLSLPSTIRLLHEQPRLLEERDDGPILIDGKRYWPSLVMVRSKEAAPATLEHSEIAGFLLHLVASCKDLCGQVDLALRDTVGQLISCVSDLLMLRVFVDARQISRPVIPGRVPTLIQRSDSRYSRLRNLRVEYFADIGNSDSYERSIRANVKDIWEIYQTFVAHVVGNALGLTYCSDSRDLRARASDGVSMRSADWKMYFDSKPPASLLASWRDQSGRPAGERPDISLVSTAVDSSVLLDAKFKSDRNPARATQADIFEMQGYLNSYNLARGGIIYPGSIPRANLIEARGNRILELPLRAGFFAQLGGACAVHDYVRGGIELARQPLSP